MNWKTKAAIQRNCARLPFREAIYRQLQKTVGNQRHKPDPTNNFKECVRLVHQVHDHGLTILDKRIMEVGTGWALDMPIALFLAGASAIATFDLHRYLRPRRVEDTLDAIRGDKENVFSIFSPIIEPKELERRLAAVCNSTTLEQLMRSAQIEYHAPADARATELPANSIDVQFSYTVFEHVPEEVLIGILRESCRILKPGGFCLHHIDPSDHFSHYDPSISHINFLQFSDAEWNFYSGNQFAYHNRSRASDYRRVFEEGGQALVQFDELTDDRSLKQLQSGFPLSSRYASWDLSQLAITNVTVISVPAGR